MKYNELNLKQKASIIKTAVKNGYRKLDDIEEAYNSYANGGGLTSPFSHAPRQAVLYADGGEKTSNYKSANSWSNGDALKGIAKAIEPVAANVMSAFRNTAVAGFDAFAGRSKSDGTAQDTYLMPSALQEQIFKDRGYTKVNNPDYGLVKKAVGKRNIPMYQQNVDEHTREGLQPIGNLDSTWIGRFEDKLEHPGNYPTAVYVDQKTQKFYQKAWDLNDYGGGAGTANYSNPIEAIGADFLDAVGSPTVVTTGIREVPHDINWMLNQPNDARTIAEDYLETKGLTTTDIPVGVNGIGGVEYNTVPSLPEVVVKGKAKKGRKKADGGPLGEVGNLNITFSAPILSSSSPKEASTPLVAKPDAVPTKKVISTYVQKPIKAGGMVSQEDADYYNSEAFKKRINVMGDSTLGNYTNRRLQSLPKATVTHDNTTGSYYEPSKGFNISDKYLGMGFQNSIEDTKEHEKAHYIYPGDYANGLKNESHYSSEYLEHLNQVNPNRVKMNRVYGADEVTEDTGAHDSNITEKIPFIYEARDAMKNLGIWDYRKGEDITPEQFQKFMKLLPKSRLGNYTDEENAIWLLNNTASINTGLEDRRYQFTV